MNRIGVPRPQFTGHLIQRNLLESLPPETATNFRKRIEALPDYLTVEITRETLDNGWRHSYEVRVAEETRQAYAGTRPVPPNPKASRTTTLQQIPYGVGQALNFLLQKTMDAAEAAARKIQTEVEAAKQGIQKLV